MTRCLFIALLATFAVLNSRISHASAQTRAPQLVLGESLERALTAGERHAYAIWLDAGQFLFATVDQIGIDVYLSILDANGNVVAAGGGQRGMHGMEHVSLFPDTSGLHWIAILPRSEQAARGNYSITLEHLEQAATIPSERIDQMFAAWDRPGSPGAAVAVVQDGELVHANGYGLAQLEYDIPIEPTTAFHMASVSKQFTAFAVAMLASEGRLSLDDDIRTYLPELYDYGDTITIRHLLYHTSGLRDQWSLLTMAGWRMDDVITRDQILRLVARQRGLNFTPGDEYLYTNTGFTLLAEIVERVTGLSFRQWTTENIFTPLGMENTHFHDDHQAIVPNRAYSYQHDPAGGYSKSVLSYANVGATSLFSTVEDLSRWTANFETGAVGGPDLIRLLRTRGVLNSGDSLDYAMGQAIGSYRGLLALYHAGADAGFRTYLLRFPHQRLSVAVLSNLGGIDAGALARQVAELYLEDQFVLADNGSAQSFEGSDSTALTGPSTLAEYLGDYDLGPGT
ncbi:serine hydrolase domain-containing protein, partial [Gemmatimonadota bacterium]